MNRRGFLKLLGLAPLAAVVKPAAPSEAAPHRRARRGWCYSEDCGWFEHTRYETAEEFAANEAGIRDGTVPQIYREPFFPPPGRAGGGCCEVPGTPRKGNPWRKWGAGGSG